MGSNVIFHHILDILFLLFRSKSMNFNTFSFQSGQWIFRNVGYRILFLLTNTRNFNVSDTFTKVWLSHRNDFILLFTECPISLHSDFTLSTERFHHLYEMFTKPTSSLRIVKELKDSLHDPWNQHKRIG